MKLLFPVTMLLTLALAGCDRPPETAESNDGPSPDEPYVEVLDTTPDAAEEDAAEDDAPDDAEP